MKTKHSTTDAELDIIYDYLNHLLNQRRFLLIDHILSGLLLHVENLHHRSANLTRDEILGYLTCCFPAQSKLSNYEFFYCNVKHLFNKGELSGLEPKESNE